MKHDVIFSALLISSTLLLSACDSGSSSAKVEQNATKVLGGKATIVLPEGYVKMPKELLEARYPSGQRPQEAWYLESEGGKVAIVFNGTSNAISESQVPQFAAMMKKQLSMYSPSVFGVTVNGKKMSRLEMTAEGVYNLMQLSSLDGKLMISAFNVTEDLKGKYEQSGKAALSSLKY